VLDDALALWWYEQDGKQAGPVTAAALARLVEEGRLLPAHLVWKDGMAGWAPVASVADFAAAVAAAPRATIPAPPPVPPPLGTQRPPGPTPGAAPGGFPRAGTAPPAQWEEISVAAVVLLSIVTFGIYGLVRFYETGRGYEVLAGVPSRFARNFWLGVGLGIAGAGLNVFHGLGLPFGIAALVFQYLALTEALRLRDEGLRRAGLTVTVTPEGTHKALFVMGALLAAILVGLVLLLVLAAKWFGDWNAIAAAARGGGRAPV
jgi:hypothetical protein